MCTKAMRVRLARNLILLSILVLTTSLVAHPTGRTAAATAQVAITVDRVIASGFVHPVQVTHAGDGSGRLFVVEQPGTVRIIKDGAVLSTPFLDITALTDDSGERGLLGLAFHPDYANNGRFYVNYTRNTDGATRIARYTASPPGSDVADPGSATEILTIAQPYSNHNGGQVAFGSDGYLYIGMGDGGSGGDPLETGQDPSDLLGAMLRIDVDGGTPYAIPPDNPYVGISGRDEVWAIGLRNPWRFSFDRDTGDLYIGDVGQNLWEEISFQKAGSPGGTNFGWDCMEGTHAYENVGPCLTATLTPPIAEYSHDEGRSITGGTVYRGTLYPALVGRYFYADYVVGKIWSLVVTDSGILGPELELETGLNISAFGEDEGGELYVVDRAGSIRALADVNGPTLPPDLSPSHKAASTLAADPGETVTYTVAIVNAGGSVPGEVSMADTVPAGLSYIPGSLSSTSGAVDDNAAPQLQWQGPVGGHAAITVTYRVGVTGAVDGGLVNHAVLTSPDLETVDLATALHVPRSVLTPTLLDLFLPGTQPGVLNAAIPPSVDCDTCHSDAIYDAWRGTLMSQAGRDVLFHAAMEVANADAGGVGTGVAGNYCLRCHTPKGWLEGRSHPSDGSELTPDDISNGVACEVCHRMVDPLPTGGEASAIDTGVRNALTATVPITYVGSGTLIVDPNDNRRGPFSFALALPYHSAYQTNFLGQASASTTRSRVCGTCHNVDNPLLSWDPGRGQYWPNAMDSASEVVMGNLFPIERTYSEWALSAYPAGVVAPQFAGDNPAGTVAACQDCHMERLTGTAVDAAFNPVHRDCAATGCLPEHLMVGGNAWMPELLQDPAWRLGAATDAANLDAAAAQARSMLSRAATLTVTLQAAGPGKTATIRVTNETGHKLPTGYPEGRQMWLHVRAFDAAGALVFESGRYDTATNRLIRDANVKVYEAKQGLTPELASLLGKPAGASFHFLLNNTVAKDNRIPPRGYTQAAWDLPGLRPVGATYADDQFWDDATYSMPASAASLTVRLYYQTASEEYVAFLKTNGGVDGETLGSLWSHNPSPPVLMAFSADPLYGVWLPIITRGY